MNKIITYELTDGKRRKWYRFHDGTKNLPKRMIKSIKEEMASKWGVELEQLKMIRTVEDEPAA